jgi:hypothetical protein
LIPSEQVFSFDAQTIRGDSMPNSQIGASFSKSAGQDSVSGTQVYLYMHYIASRGSTLSGEISEHSRDSDDQGSVPSHYDFFWPRQTSNMNSIPSEPVSFFSNEQDSMFRQQVPPCSHQISDESSSSDLSQDTIAILQ